MPILFAVIFFRSEVQLTTDRFGPEPAAIGCASDERAALRISALDELLESF
jgi:hypothetical protein